MASTAAAAAAAEPAAAEDLPMSAELKLADGATDAYLLALKSAGAAVTAATSVTELAELTELPDVELFDGQPATTLAAPGQLPHVPHVHNVPQLQQHSELDDLFTLLQLQVRPRPPRLQIVLVYCFCCSCFVLLFTVHCSTAVGWGSQQLYSKACSGGSVLPVTCPHCCCSCVTGRALGLCTCWLLFCL
jgi:hypothetical protein